MFFPLSEGRFIVNNDKNLISYNPEKPVFNRRKGTMIIDIQPFVVISEKENILLDTGLGNKINNTLQIESNLLKKGIKLKGIDKVLISHLHYDHIGGICFEKNNKISLAFPNAVYYVNYDEWENTFSNKSDKINYTFLEFLYHSGQIKFIHGNEPINKNIFCEVSGGHTPFHQVFIIKSENGIYFYGGDVVPQSNFLLHKIKAKFDYDSNQSILKRKEFLERGFEENWIFLFYHSQDLPAIKVIQTDGNFNLIKIK